MPANGNTPSSGEGANINTQESQVRHALGRPLVTDAVEKVRKCLVAVF